MTSITVVTPWHNAHELQAQFMAALATALDPCDDLIVVDNASDPPLFPSPNAFFFTHALAESNLGFSRACNHGLREAKTAAVLFLNNDIVHTRDGWLEPIRQALRPGVLVGAELNPGYHAKVDGRCFPYLAGWCLAGMRDDLLSLGGWDEGFEEPSYYGDNDLCVRARAAGMRLVQVAVGLRHLGNYTSRRMDVGPVSQRNYLRYAARVAELFPQPVAA